MNIEPYIAQLLYRYQCVTVPGFGAFLAENQSSQLNLETHSFSPPRKVISFNSLLVNNDGLLANHIAQSEKTSYEYAVSAIQYEVFLWKKELEENGSISLKNIGAFSATNDQKLIFTPNTQTNYLTNSFGLSPFVSPIVKREVFQAEIAAIEETPVLELSTETTSGRSYLKYAAVLLMGLGLLSTVGYTAYQQQLESETLLVEKAVQVQVQNKIQEATFFIKSPIPAVSLTIKENKMSYHIMSGAFRSEANAEKELKKLTHLGFNAKRIPINKSGLYPVLFGSYATYAEAHKAQVEIVKNQNPDAWILIESL